MRISLRILWMVALVAACAHPVAPEAPADTPIPACTPETPPDVACVSMPGDPPPPPHP